MTLRLLRAFFENSCCSHLVGIACTFDDASRKNHLFFEGSDGRPQSEFEHVFLSFAQALSRISVPDVATISKDVMVFDLPECSLTIRTGKFRYFAQLLDRGD